MIDIIFIIPNPEPFVKETLGSVPPIGLIYLHNELKRHGFSSIIFDCSKRGNTYATLCELIRSNKPQCLGFSFGTEIRFDAFALAEKTKREFPTIVHLAGGPHPTLADLDTITNVPHFDLIVRGEGEVTLVELMQRLRDGKSYEDLPGITYRKNGQPTRNPNASLIRDLDRLDSPYVARDIIEQFPYFYEDKHGERHPMAVIFTGRGCPFKCSFCGTALFWGRQSRMRSNDNILAEIRFIIETYGIRHFYFLDDTFNVNVKKLNNMLERVISELPPITWMAGLRIDSISHELLVLMKRAGCVKVTYGVESATQELVDQLIQKEIDLGKVPLIESWLKDVGIERRCFFIIGHPGETRAQADDTIRMIKELGGDTTLSILRIYPGTRIEELAREKGILRHDFNWSKVELSQTYLRSLIGSSPIYIDTLSWFDISCYLFEWANSGQAFFSVWKQVPRAITDIRSLGDVKKLLVMGAAFVWIKIKKIGAIC